MTDPGHSLAATITGTDAPGLLTRVMAALAGTDAEILDLEQTVVRGQLSIGVCSASRRRLTRWRTGWPELAPAGTDRSSRRHRRQPAPTQSRHRHDPGTTAVDQPVAITTAIIAEHGGNIDRSRGCHEPR